MKKNEKKSVEQHLTHFFTQLWLLQLNDRGRQADVGGGGVCATTIFVGSLEFLQASLPQHLVFTNVNLFNISS